MFWSQPDVYTKYMDHVLPSSESSDEDEGANEDDEYSDDDNEDADDSDYLVDGELKDFEFDVNDKVDAYWHGDELTTAGWEFAIVREADKEFDRYTVVYDFNGEEVK